MWSAWICMQSTDLIPIIPDWMSYPSFSWKPEDRLWKAHWRVYGWNNFHSVVLCQYVVNYAYSRYVNFPLKREEEKNKDTTAGRAQDAPFPARAQSPLLVLLLRSSQRIPSLTLNTPALLCKQMFFLWCQFFQFSHLEKVFFRAKAPKWQETASVHGSAREGDLWAHGRLWKNTVVIKPRARAAEERERGSTLFTTPVMRCSEQRRRKTGILMATVRQEDMCWGKDLGVYIYINIKEAFTDSLRTWTSPACQCFFSAPRLFSQKLRW